MKNVIRIIIFVIVVIILIATFWFVWKSSRPEMQVYAVVSPKMGNVQHTTTVTGNIEPRNETEVKPEISGIISKILKETGQNIKENDVIATLRIIPEASEINTAKSRVRVANISLDQISKEYDRQRMLYDSDVISKNDYEIIEAKYQEAVEEENNAEEALEIAKTGTSSKSDFVDNTQIRSRISGTILDIPVKIGNMVINSNPFNEGTTIAVVANMNDLIFRGTIDETEVGNVRIGMPLNITVGAIPNETIEAELEYIAPNGKKENGTVLYEIKAAIKMPEKIPIRANYSANANIMISEINNVITVPESAVEFGKDGLNYVYVLKSKASDPQIFEKTQITIGLSDGNNIEVKSGLALTDQIRGIKIETQTK